MDAPGPKSEQRILERCALALREGTLAERHSAVHDVDRLFAAQQDRIYALCLRLLRDPERAREISQDAMVTAYQRLPDFRGDARFSTWLYQIAKFHCMNALRRKKDLLTEDGILDAADPARSVLAGLRQHEKETLLAEASAAVLDATEQEAVYLRYVEALPLDQITDLLQVDAASGARGVLQRCKRKLRRELRRRLEEMGHGSSFMRGSV